MQYEFRNGVENNMSYAFGMYFIEMSQVNVLPFVDMISDKLANSSKEYIERNAFYIPSLRYKSEDNRIDDYWLNTLFEISFVYWPKKQLLGLCGYEYPDNVKEMFTSFVYFQNSTDRDYDYADWPASYVFQKHVHDSVVMDKKSVIQKYMKVNNCDSKEAKEFYDSDPHYFRRSLVYDSVYKDLALDDWLWGKDNLSFIRFTVQSINDDKKKFNALTQMASIRKSFLEECEKDDQVSKPNKDLESDDEKDFDLE